MSTIDEIMAAVEAYSDASFDAGDYQIKANQEKCIAAEAPIRGMITTAIAEARREGAEAMRESAAQSVAGVPIAGHIEDASTRIRALPLPAGKRQAVRLTDEQIAMALHVWAGFDPTELNYSNWRNDKDCDGLIEISRAIEAAVLKANGLEGGAL